MNDKSLLHLTLLLIGAVASIAIYLLGDYVISVYSDHAFSVIVTFIFFLLFFAYLLIRVRNRLVHNFIGEVPKNGLKEQVESINSISDLSKQEVFEKSVSIGKSVASILIKREVLRTVLLIVNLSIILIGGVLGTVLLRNQNDIVENQNLLIGIQNDLIINQNRRLDQQTYLQEANRRSNLVFLFSNIMDALDKELQDSDERKLTPQLISRIISLSQRLKPYRFLENDSLTVNEISPERGQLFTNLVKSEIHEESLNVILKEGNFQYTELTGIEFSSVSLNNIDFSNSRFQEVEFNNVEFNECIFENMSTNDIELDSTKFYSCTFNSTVLDCNIDDYSSFSNCKFDSSRIYSNDYSSESRLEFYGSEFINSSIDLYCDTISLIGTKFINTELEFRSKITYLDRPYFIDKDAWVASNFEDELRLKQIGYSSPLSKADSIEINYLIVESRSINYPLLTFNLDSSKYRFVNIGTDIDYEDFDGDKIKKLILVDTSKLLTPFFYYDVINSYHLPFEDKISGDLVSVVYDGVGNKMGNFLMKFYSIKRQSLSDSNDNSWNKWMYDSLSILEVELHDLRYEYPEFVSQFIIDNLRYKTLSLFDEEYSYKIHSQHVEFVDKKLNYVYEFNKSVDLDYFDNLIDFQKTMNEDNPSFLKYIESIQNLYLN